MIQQSNTKKKRDKKVNIMSYIEKPKSKYMYQHLYCCTSSQSHNDAFNEEQKLTPHCMLKTASGIFSLQKAESKRKLEK